MRGEGPAPRATRMMLDIELRTRRAAYGWLMKALLTQAGPSSIPFGAKSARHLRCDAIPDLE